MFDLRYLLDFLDLARTGNFSLTARNRGISQPALTRRIQQLEQWAGRRLLDRSTTPLKLTPAGVEFCPVATRIVEELDAFGRQGKQGAKAPIRCMLIHALGNWLHDPGAGGGPTISFGTYDRCFAALRDNDIDVALVYRSDSVQDARFKGLARVRIGADVFVPVASADYLAKTNAAAGGIVVELSRDNYLGQALAATFERCKRRPGYVEGPLATRIDAVRGYVEAGYGIGWLPASMIRADLDSGRLCRIEDPALEVKLDVVLIGSENDKVAAAAHLISRADRSRKPDALHPA